jgi:uncharacterized YccA/Bax inhibitor family protein
MSKMDRFSKSNNPMLSEETYRQSAVLDEHMVIGNTEGTMTVNGAVNKTFILFGIMLLGAAFGFMNPVSTPVLIGCSLGGAALMFFASRYLNYAHILAPSFALLEGLLVGTITAYYMYAFEGIVFNAVTLTMAILFMMLTLYKAGIIKVTDKFRSGVSMAVGAIMLLYLVNIVLYFFGISMPFLHNGGPIAIGISCVIVGVASLNLLLDFDSFERGAAYGAPKSMEWVSGMGLLFTLIWLYLEILRLLSYLNRD